MMNVTFKSSITGIPTPLRNSPAFGRREQVTKLDF